MRALTVLPTKPNTLAVTDVDEPAESDGDVLVEVLAVGVCGTDHEIINGEYGAAPPGQERLVLGHESLGRVLEAPAGSDLNEGDHVVCIVRRPDPVPCENCAHDRWDMCRNGQFTEHGINGIDGFMRERYRANVDRLVRVDRELGLTGVLLEPTTVVAKAWEEIDIIASRSPASPRTALITGAGPIGLLAALLGCQRGIDVTVLDHATSGRKPELVQQLGAKYTHEKPEDLDAEFDVVIECTGAPVVIAPSVGLTGPDGIVCLTGVSSPGGVRKVDVGGVNRELVLENSVVFGTVNAARQHYTAGAKALAEADTSWLQGILTRRVPMPSPDDAFSSDDISRRGDDVKVVLMLSDDL